MQIEAAAGIGKDFARQDADRKLMPFAQALGQRGPDIAPAETHLVGEMFGRAVEIGEMVAPALDFAARSDQRIVALGCGARCIVVKASERSSGVRRGGEQFVDLFAIDREVRETLVG